MIHFIAAFLSGMAGDMLAVLDFHYTNKNKAVASAIVSMLISGAVLFVFVDVSQNPILALPYLAGVGLGAFLGVMLKKRLESKLK